MGIFLFKKLFYTQKSLDFRCLRCYNSFVTRIFNIDCRELMKSIPDEEVDLILTSPPYNTNKKTGKNGLNDDKTFPYVRYDVHTDDMDNEQYTSWIVDIFNDFNRILSKDGVVLWNANYGANNTECLFLTISSIISQTPFTIADVICWKKSSAVPNNMSPNKLTRIWEPVFVFVRKSDFSSFHSNKKIMSVRSTGQKNYENIFNFIEAKNNDGICKLNRCTYSSDFCEKLLKIYGIEGMTVFDPFMGTGTTGVATSRLDMNFIGSEISEAQCNYAAERLDCEVEKGPF